MAYALHTPYGPVAFRGEDKAEEWAADYIIELQKPVRYMGERVALAVALCDGYTLEELRGMSLTFKSQIEVLRGRVAP